MDAEEPAAPSTLSEAFQRLSMDMKDFCWPNEIERIQKPSPAEFYREYVAANKPVIIMNAFDDWPALKRWDLDYLRKKAGALQISIDLTPAGHGDCIVEKDGKNYFVKPMQYKTRFANYIDYLVGKRKQEGVYYLQKQNDNFRLEFQLLHNDVLPNVQQWGEEAFGVSPDAVNLWMGDSRAVSSMHKDFYENLYCVVRGQKHFTLLPPTDLAYINYVDCIGATYNFAEREPGSGEGTFAINVDEPQHTVPWIPFDIEREGEDIKYPEIKRMSPLRITVNEGEMLYLPSLNFHRVAQTSDAEGKVLAINYWFDMKFDIKYAYFQFLDHVARISKGKK
eukprot:TRINITY_DN7453_c0_g1_i1.p1 TRINITY_DN7453_c0_g1~~TRINITY_DN7453_c0_g1_i1.p1  ORF type:complete len:336 (+),score=52.70 TRINITY_DN7453_c0_g1_i1:35-1042(+)